MRIKKLIASLSVAGLLGVLVSASVVSPASAAQNYLVVCNSSASVTYIAAYDRFGAYSTHIAVGTCSSPLWNSNDNVRVDVEDNNFGSGDVDSYRIGVIGEGYGPLHCGENEASNPPNDAPNGVRYNTNGYGC